MYIAIYPHMKKTVLFCILPALIIGVTSCDRGERKQTVPQRFSHNTRPADAGFDEMRLSRIDSLLEGYVKQGILPNAVTFVARHARVVHHKAFGWRDLEKKIPVQKDDIFRIASQTKAITSVALMTLFEEGRFLPDDPLSKYIPEFSDPVVLESFNEKDTTYTARPATSVITIRHLLNHTSGIAYGVLHSGPANMIFAKAGVPAVNSLDSLTTEQVVKTIATLPLMFDPGEKYLYGMNSDVIGYLIEVLSGKKLDEFLQERIFLPLGMNDTYFYLPEEKAGRLVTLYSSTPGGLRLHTNSSYQTYPVAGARIFLSGGAGLNSTIEDYARFCQMVLNGGMFNNHRIISRKTLEMMTMDQTGDKYTSATGSSFGLGFEIFGGEAPAIHLISEGTLRWGGMYSTSYWIDPAEDMVFLVYTNVQPYMGPRLRFMFQTMVYQALE